MQFRWHAWVCVSSVWRSLDTLKSSLPLSSVCFQTWSFWSVPPRVILTPYPSMPSHDKGRSWEQSRGRYQCLPVLISRLFGHWRIQECLVFTEKCFSPQRLDWNDAKARVATVRAREVPLPTSGVFSTQHPFFLHSFCPRLLLSLCFLVTKTFEGTEGWLPHPHASPTVCSHMLCG